MESYLPFFTTFCTSFRTSVKSFIINNFIFHYKTKRMENQFKIYINLFFDISYLIFKFYNKCSKYCFSSSIIINKSIIVFKKKFLKVLFINNFCYF